MNLYQISSVRQPYLTKATLAKGFRKLLLFQQWLISERKRRLSQRLRASAKAKSLTAIQNWFLTLK